MWERGNKNFSVEKSYDRNEKSNDNRNEKSNDNRNEKSNDNRYNNDRPNNERPSNERPRNDRPNNERPSNERPSNERPRNERPSNERPSNERPRNERPRNERPSNERPSNERPSNNRYNRNDRCSNDRYRTLRRKEPVKKVFVNPLCVPIDVEQSCEETQQVSYLEHCKMEQEKEKEKEKEKDILKKGWVSYKCIGTKIKCSRDGINYYDTIEDSYTEEEKIENEEREALELSIRFYNMVNELDEKYEQQSYEHYEMYGELDFYAKSIIERQKYEEYEKQFMIVDEDENGSSDEENDIDNLDN
jgi:hypothetical protein